MLEDAYCFFENTQTSQHIIVVDLKWLPLKRAASKQWPLQSRDFPIELLSSFAGWPVLFCQHKLLFTVLHPSLLQMNVTAEEKMGLSVSGTRAQIWWMMRKFPSKLGALTFLQVMLHVPWPFTDKEANLISLETQTVSSTSIMKILAQGPRTQQCNKFKSTFKAAA